MTLQTAQSIQQAVVLHNLLQHATVRPQHHHGRRKFLSVIRGLSKKKYISAIK